MAEVRAGAEIKRIKGNHYYCCSKINVIVSDIVYTATTTWLVL